EIGDVGELEEIVARGRGELFEPDRGIYTSEPPVESDEFGVLPAGIDQVDELAEFFKAEEEEEMRVPMTPEMQEFGGPAFAVEACVFGGAEFEPGQHEDCGCDC